MAHHSTKRSKRHRAATPPARGRTVAAAALTAVAAAAGVCGTAAAAPAAGPGSGASDTDRGTVKAQIAALYRQADQLTQTFDAAQEQESALSLAVQRSQSKLQTMQADYEHQRAAIGAIAANQYRAGGVDQRLALMLADHPETFLGNEAMATRVSDQQSRKVAEVIEERRQIVQLQRAAADQLSALNQTRDTAARSRTQVTEQLHKAQSLLNTLSAPQRRAAIQADLGADPASPFTGEQPDPNTPDQNLPAPSDRARAAIEAAIADLGKPYVFGAEGPDAFDCSGLIQQAWRQAGVELPRTSSEQAQAGQQIPLSQIQPGDLVIYYAGRSHIGMYVGDGKIIHAPHPGTQVRYAPLMSMPVNMVVRV
ncbi:NLP/P60 protein [Catenulispora acidiphila DSM 44928]|uniref:NLP/P60 protein n=1 Tax=Catenulispora acidiphila (strain DSM 44928 / JCM 14897 / NBRC 102108 / NRRL B-24433 / ID139908) TaxID=479433 RepID=C7QGS0_CATAD|nr:C40 family peptidase [Catenulispora acidiphila]ACU74950.1 NLP/P60 protein [Catenulispora acidiphila DSM 44928]